MAKKKTSARKPRSSEPSAAKKPPTVQRTYRFDTELVERFEEECAKNLANPKLVIEAALLYYLDADLELRHQIAQNHRKEFGTSTGYRSTLGGG
ncbi:MAG: hypothetical protein AAF710_00555 [Planctomycetota bacterium]